MKNTLKNDPGLKNLVLGCFLGLCWTIVVLDGNASHVLASEKIPNSSSSSFHQLVMERVRTSLEGKTWHEQPDHVLYQLAEQKWSRVLRDALGLPSWVEFSLRNRTRYESVSHTWRRGQLGQNDVQLLQKSNVRLGATRGPFSILFEGYDARTHFQDLPNDFDGLGLINHTDILQLFASGTFHNTFGTGLRTDIHFGRLTFDFGSNRLVGRNVYPNVVNAFDGLHVNVGDGNKWRGRAFIVEPRLLKRKELDTQSARQVFWGTLVEFKQNPWAIVGPYYLGLNDSVLPVRRVLNTFGLRVHKEPGINGLEGFEYELEGAVQTGTRGQTDHFAYMGVAAIGYTFNVPWTPRFRVLYEYASGNRTPGGSENQRFIPLFSLRRFDMMVTGNFGPFFSVQYQFPRLENRCAAL